MLNQEEMDRLEVEDLELLKSKLIKLNLLSFDFRISNQHKLNVFIIGQPAASFLFGY